MLDGILRIFIHFFNCMLRERLQNFSLCPVEVGEINTFS